MKILIMLMMCSSVACKLDIRCLNDDAVDFFAAGLKICSDYDTDPAEVEFIVNTVIEQAAIRYPKLLDVDFQSDLEYYNVRVAILDDHLVTGCRKINHRQGGEAVYACEDNLGGINFNGDAILIEGNRSCLSWSALDHELLHTINLFYLDRDGSGHGAPWMFIQDSGFQSIDPQETIELRTRNINVNEFTETCR